jgi:hypothetical protein
VDQNKLSLATLSGGAAIERFDLALAEVVENMLDVNTNPKQDRVITLTAKIKPREDRQMAQVTIEVKTRLAAVTPFALDMFMGTTAEGEAVALEANPNQMKLFPGQEKGKTYVINKGGKE